MFNQSFHFPDVIPSQDNLFQSQLSGVGLFSSFHQNQNQNQNQNGNGNVDRQILNDENVRTLRLKQTSSYDRISN